ncbi:MAG: hypothetical protein JNN17_03440 [Verrucomicrobiaceae bacterium]|nr:hypothetical protein [Verrucomicrobiaceae bacterium]
MAYKMNDQEKSEPTSEAAKDSPAEDAKQSTPSSQGGLPSNDTKVNDGGNPASGPDKPYDYAGIHGQKRNDADAEKDIENDYLEKLFASPQPPRDIDASPFVSIPDWESAKADFAHTRCIVIHSTGLQMEAAAHLMARTQAMTVYETNAKKAGPGFTSDILRILCSAAIEGSACVIMSYIGNEKSFEATCRNISKAVAHVNDNGDRTWRSSRSFIIYTHSKGVEKLVANNSWFENIALLEIPDTAREAKSAGYNSLRTVVDGLHETPPTDFAEIVARERETYIPFILTRIAVLFPNLTTTNFERLVDHILGTREIEVTPGTKESDARTAGAKSLWRSAKPYFEKQAGLVRASLPGEPQRFRFWSKEMEDKANAWGWEDPEALFFVFSDVSGMNILFGEHVGREDEELFSGYLAAAVQLAIRAPGLFGARWLETLARDYAAWVHLETDQLTAKGIDIFSLLGQLVKAAKQRKLWGRFSERMGELLNQLFRDGIPALVDQFMDRLFKQGLHGLALLVALNITEAREEWLTEWMKRVMNEGDADDRRTVIYQIVREICRGTDSAAPRLQAILDWSVSKNTSVQRAAYSFPAVLIDFVDGKEFDPNSDTSPLVRAMTSPSPVKETVQGLCEHLMNAKFFPSGAAECHDGNELDAVAITLFQFANGLPNGQLLTALKLARFTMSWMKLREQTEVRKWWQGFADYLATQKRAIPITAREESKMRLADLDRRYSICKTLIRH